jgi:hypothetical protein
VHQALHQLQVGIFQARQDLQEGTHATRLVTSRLLT